MPDDGRLILVWINPFHEVKPQSRLLTSLFDTKTGFPLSFSLDYVQKSPIFREITPSTSESLANDIYASTPQKPALVPTILAQFKLGWLDFTPADED